MAIFWRSWATLAGLIAAVLAILALLSILQFQAILSGFIESRLSVLARTTQSSFQAATRLGLPLAGVRNAQAILERARQTDYNIRAIHVFDESGRILHSTEPDPPASIRAEALFAQGASTSGAWSVETKQNFFSGMRISDPAGRSVGGVVIVYPDSDLVIPAEAMIARLAVDALLTFLAVALLGWFVVRYGLRDLLRVLGGVEAIWVTLERRSWRVPAGGAAAAPEPVHGAGLDTGRLIQELETAEGRYRAAGRALTARADAGAPDDRSASGALTP